MNIMISLLILKISPIAKNIKSSETEYQGSIYFISIQNIEFLI